MTVKELLEELKNKPLTYVIKIDDGDVKGDLTEVHTDHDSSSVVLY